ncbi:MAG: hypothetical protein AAF702_34675 [Chloroflexota bacterium]
MKISLRGFLSGILTLLSLVLGTYLGFMLVTLLFLVLGELSTQAASIPTGAESALSQVGDQLGKSFVRLLNGLWRDRIGFMLAGLLGVVATWSDRFGQLIYPEKRRQIGFVGIAIAVVVPVITWLTVQQAEIGALVAEQPEAFGWRDLIAGSSGMTIGLALIFGLPLAYIFWAVWQRWDAWLGRLFGQVEPESVTAQASAGSIPPIVKSTQVGQVLMGLLLVSIFGYWMFSQFHSQIAIRIQHGTVRLDAISTPQFTLDLTIREDVRSLQIVKREGSGEVHLLLQPPPESASSAQQIDGWSFTKADPNQYQRFAVADMEPGIYQLQFQQERGVGYFEYSLSHGGGPVSNLVGIGMGVLLASGFGLALALGLWGAVRFGLIG